MSSILAKGVVRNGRIEVAEPIDLPDGAKVIVTSDESAVNEDGPMSPEEIARVHAAMQSLLPLDIPDDVAKDLDAWERKLFPHRQ
jgi:hypothetical protein